ncbi:hypothetical protein GCM10023339_17250 [Alloalcanivorax gelatiniphagus]
MTATPSVVLEATAVHDDAMLARVTSAIGLHPVGSFSYTPDEAGTATILIEVRGDERQQSRVRSRLQRLVGVLEVTGPAASRSTS